MIERLIHFMWIVAILAVIWLGLTHPTAVAGVITTIVSGVVTFVSAIFNGTAAVMH
jgi:hypothetical protein